MTGPRAISDPRPVVYMGAVGSFVFGFVSVAAVLLAGYKIARRWVA